MKRERLMILVGLAVFLIGSCVAVIATAADQPSSGFIYGKVKTRVGKTYTGVIRWGNEEAFWDDHFNANKKDLPYLKYHEDGEGDRRSHGLEIFGRRLLVDLGVDSRLLTLRFGDLRSLRVEGSDEATLVLKNGTEIEVEGGSNDLGATLHVHDDSVGDIEIPWRKLDLVEFLPTPESVKPEGRRLWGTVATEDGEFSGYIQWDKQECLSIDRLDGESEDGDMSIEMGRIKSIERRGRRGARLTLRDGRSLELEDTNDVDSSNRGIMVEDERFGRVVVPWGSFEKLNLRDDKGSGHGYADFPACAPLFGTVTDDEGVKHSGRIVFDLDEEEGCEVLNGSHEDIEYNIPFDMIASIAPRGDDEAVVTLRGGAELTLEDSQDVSDRNDGVLVFANKARRPVYVRWDDIRRIDLDWRARRTPVEAEDSAK